MRHHGRSQAHVCSPLLRAERFVPAPRQGMGRALGHRSGFRPQSTALRLGDLWKGMQCLDHAKGASALQAGLIECGATALFLFFTIGTITSGRSQSGSTRRGLSTLQQAIHGRGAPDEVFLENNHSLLPVLRSRKSPSRLPPFAPLSCMSHFAQAAELPTTHRRQETLLGWPELRRDLVCYRFRILQTSLWPSASPSLC